MKNPCRSKWTFLVLLLLSLSFLFTATVVSINFLLLFLETTFDHPKLIESFGLEVVVDEQKQRENQDVYIPGAGFSGFFYTLGRLEALHNQHNISSSTSSYEYYCFSAGCLALVASLLNLPIDSAIELAHTSRHRWIMGEISRYDVVEYFVDCLLTNIEKEGKNVTGSIDAMLLSGYEKVNATTSCKRIAECNTADSRENEHEMQRNNNVNLLDYLPRINVITSKWSNEEQLISQYIQKPACLQHLKRILVQTTWIPFVTGSSFGFFDETTGLHHNDGAFAGLLQNLLLKPKNGEQYFPPRQYDHSLLLPWNFDLLSNGLNMLLSHDKAVHFWKEGLERGGVPSSIHDDRRRRHGKSSSNHNDYGARKKASKSDTNNTIDGCIKFICFQAKQRSTQIFIVAFNWIIAQCYYFCYLYPTFFIKLFSANNIR